MADSFEIVDDMLAQVTGGFDSDEIGREYGKIWTEMMHKYGADKLREATANHPEIVEKVLSEEGSQMIVSGEFRAMLEAAVLELK
jgi:hypothetical protein